MQDKLLIQFISSTRWAFPARNALDIALHFSQCGWETYALTRDIHSIDRRIHLCGIPTVHSPLRSRFDFSTLLPIISSLRTNRQKHVVLHTHSVRDASIAAMARAIVRHPSCKVILTPHGAEAVKECQAYLLPSDFKYPLGKFSLASMMPVKNFIPSLSVNTDAYSVPDFPSAGPVCAAYKGEITPEAGLEPLIEALIMLRDCRIRILIAGYGMPDYLDSLRRKAISSGVMDYIDWTRDTPNPFISLSPAYFCLLPPSRTHSPIFSDSYIESRLDYQAAGRHFISLPEKPDEIATLLRGIALDKQHLRQLGMKEKEYFENNCSWRQYSASLERIYSPETDFYLSGSNK